MIDNSMPLKITSEEFYPIAENRLFGFWIYLLSDCILFAVLFATYLVLRASFHSNLIENPFQLKTTLIETYCLLTSSFTCGLAILNIHQNKKGVTLFFLLITFLLGSSFIFLEGREFHHLIQIGEGPQQQAFFSGFFALVGTHGLHVSFGLVWMMIMFLQILFKGIIPSTHLRLITFSLFWHFLDIIWIFIFTVVYLLGNLS